MNNNIVNVVVFAEHSIKRYIERVLHKNISTRETFYDYIIPNIRNSFRIILPSPTHPFSRYVTIADALFLGDFDYNDFTNDEWLKTCISLNEAGESQSKILKTLKTIQEDLNIIGSNPYDPHNEAIDEDDIPGSIIKMIPNTEEGIMAFLDLTKKIFLINKLYLLLDYPFIDKILPEINYIMLITKRFLKSFEIDYTKLTPYGKDGIAKRGELDFKK